MAGEPQLTEIAVIQADGNANKGYPRLKGIAAVQRDGNANRFKPLLSAITVVQRVGRYAWPPDLYGLSVVQRFAGLLPPPPPPRPPTTTGPAHLCGLKDVDCIPSRLDVKRGNALNAWTTLAFAASDYRVLDVRAWDKPLDIRWAPWDDPTAWSLPDEIPADSFKSFDGRVAAVQVRNANVGAVARYQVIGFRKKT